MPHFKIYSFLKEKKSLMESLANTDGTHGTLQAVRWPFEPIIWWIGYFEGLTEVQLNSL